MTDPTPTTPIPSDSPAPDPDTTPKPPRRPKKKSKPPRPQKTHFVGIPLHHAPGLQSTLDTFRSDPLVSALNLHANAFRPAAALHLTIGVMSLTTPEQLESATNLLHSLDLQKLLQESSADPADAAPLNIDLAGLATFGGPRATVLYAVPRDATGRLQAFAENVYAKFSAAELLEPLREPLQLHATIVNTTYVPGRKVLKVDWSHGLAEERVGKMVFAESVDVGSVGIFKMGALPKDGVKGAGGYQCVAEKIIGETMEGKGAEEKVEEKTGGDAPTTGLAKKVLSEVAERI